MKQLIFGTLIIIGLLIISSLDANAQTRCIMPKPFCPWPMNPVCICESEWSFNCNWGCQQ